MRAAMIAILGAALISPVLVGCGDKEISKTDTTTKNPDGSMKQTQDKTVQNSDGSVTHQTSSQNVPASH
jgi:hypothetical protein